MPQNEQGAVSGRYSVIPRTLIFITRGDEVLLLRGAPTKRLWPGQYNGIGGHIERGEDVLSSARRELLEESGLEVDNLRLCGTVMVDAGGELGVVIFILHGECPFGGFRSSAEGFLKWIKIEELNRYSLVEDVPVLLDKILEMRAETQPFSARYCYNEKDELQIVFGS